MDIFSKYEFCFIVIVAATNLQHSMSKEKIQKKKTGKSVVKEKENYKRRIMNNGKDVFF